MSRLLPLAIVALGFDNDKRWLANLYGLPRLEMQFLHVGASIKIRTITVGRPTELGGSFGEVLCGAGLSVLRRGVVEAAQQAGCGERSAQLGFLGLNASVACPRGRGDRVDSPVHAACCTCSQQKVAHDGHLR